MEYIDVPDQTLRDWDRIQAEIEASHASDCDDSDDSLASRFVPMTATAENLFDFGHRLSREYLP